MGEEHIFQVRIRYSETDQMGYVYYGNYARFFEIGRTEMMRAAGIRYKEMEAEGIMMPVMSMEVKYIRPALYDEVITIRTIVQKLDKRQIVFVSRIYNDSGELLNRGIVKLCFVDKTTHKRINTPTFIFDILPEKR